MFLLYRLYSGLFFLLLLVRIIDSGKKTQSASSNSIADDTEETTDAVIAVLNDQFLPALDSANNSQPKNRLNVNNYTDKDRFGSGKSGILPLIDWNVTWPYFNTGCQEWLPTNHAYFQLANSFLFLSYLAPAGLYGLLYLRSMLAIGSAFLAIWGWIILCAFDTFLWNAVFFIINFVHGLYILFTLRPVKFDKQVEEVSTLFDISFVLATKYPQFDLCVTK